MQDPVFAQSGIDIVRAVSDVVLAQTGIDQSIPAGDADADEAGVMAVVGDGGVLGQGLAGVNIKCLGCAHGIPVGLVQNDADITNGEGIGLGIVIGEVCQSTACNGDCQQGDAQHHCNKLFLHFAFSPL